MQQSPLADVVRKSILGTTSACPSHIKVLPLSSVVGKCCSERSERNGEAFGLGGFARPEEIKIPRQLHRAVHDPCNLPHHHDVDARDMHGPQHRERIESDRIIGRKRPYVFRCVLVANADRNPPQRGCLPSLNRLLESKHRQGRNWIVISYSHEHRVLDDSRAGSPRLVTVKVAMPKG